MLRMFLIIGEVKNKDNMQEKFCYECYRELIDKTRFFCSGECRREFTKRHHNNTKKIQLACGLITKLRKKWDKNEPGWSETFKTELTK